MKISTSLLSIWNDTDKIKEIDSSLTDFIHLDVTDGIFVDNKSYYNHINSFQKKVDIHLMVADIKKEVDKYLYVNPEYITFHLEATSNAKEMIDYIKSKKIKVGIALSPSTPISKIVPYLPFIDLVLLLSVTPGYGGQSFLEETPEKVEELKKYKDKYSFVIEIDGGINKDTIKKCKGADIVVVGSFITLSSNFNDRILELKENIL